jgi:hypothetical protein
MSSRVPSASPLPRREAAQNTSWALVKAPDSGARAVEPGSAPGWRQRADAWLPRDGHRTPQPRTPATRASAGSGVKNGVRREVLADCADPLIDPPAVVLGLPDPDPVVELIEAFSNGHGREPAAQEPAHLSLNPALLCAPAMLLTPTVNGGRPAKAE